MKIKMGWTMAKVMFLTVMLGGTSMAAVTVSDTKSVAAQAVIGALSNLSISILKIAGGADTNAQIDFTNTVNQGEWATLPEEYVKIIVKDNTASWRLRAYTDNFTTAPSTATWGYQYGGLKGSVDSAKIPMGWMCLPNTDTNASGGPGTGNPSTGTVNGWTYIKDYHDVDDPLAAGDSSFAAADSGPTGGYTNIAFGSNSFTRIVRPNLTAGNEALTAPSDPFYLYFEGQLKDAIAATYTGTIKLDLINE